MTGIFNPPDIEEECEHEELEDRCCIQCGKMIEMKYAWEHDSGDMER